MITGKGEEEMANGVLLGSDMVGRRFIQRRIRDLSDGFIVTDAIFMRDPSNTLAITYEENSLGLNADEKNGEVEQRKEGGKYPRIAISAETKQALIKDYGLSTLITYEAIKYNKIASIDRSFITLKNSVVRYVDIKGLRVLTDNYNTASTRINTLVAGAAWNAAGADHFGDLMRAKAKVDGKGYIANTAVVNPEDWTSALINKDFRDAMDKDIPAERKIVRSGMMGGHIAGLTIVLSANISKGFMWVGQDQVIGNRSETNDGVDVDVYKEDNSAKASTVVDAFREVEHYLTDPLAGTLVSGL